MLRRKIFAMNKRFFRLVLYVMRRTEKQSSRYGNAGLHFAWTDMAFRWNGLMCCVAFTPMFLMLLFDDSGKWPILSTIGFGGFLVYFWFLTMNGWYFHRMRRKRAFREARQRTRWMLNATPWCFAGLVLSYPLTLLVPALYDTGEERNLLSLYIGMALVFPFLSTYLWVVVAITPFRTGYVNAGNRAAGRRG